MDQDKKEKNKYWPIIITGAVTFLIGLILAFGVWYLMDQKAKKSATESGRQIMETAQKLATAEAQNDALLEKAARTLTQSTINVTNSTADVDTLRTFCLAGGGSNNPDIKRLQYVTTANGAYAECTVGEKGFSTGTVLIYARMNGKSWEKLTLTNNTIDKAACDKYRIPHEISGTCTD